jgi:hypothetical protein
MKFRAISKLLEETLRCLRWIHRQELAATFIEITFEVRVVQNAAKLPVDSISFRGRLLDQESNAIFFFDTLGQGLLPVKSRFNLHVSLTGSVFFFSGRKKNLHLMLQYLHEIKTFFL